MMTLIGLLTKLELGFVNNKLKNYDFITTDDGSITAFSKLYGEACHSTSGARNETILHYIEGCKVLEKANQKPITIFEVGFGVGIGYEETQKKLSQLQYRFISIEIDEDLIKYYLENNKELILIERTDYYYKCKSLNHEIFLIFGDGRITVPRFFKEFDFTIDCIYQDAFSPKRNAILWTTEWFQLLKDISNNECIMSTYSSSSSIRKSMIQAGWRVLKGEQFGPKRSSTRAVLIGESDPDILTHLERSPVDPITDNNYKAYTLGNKNEKN